MEPRSGKGLGYNDHGPPEIEGLNSVLRLYSGTFCLLRQKYSTFKMFKNRYSLCHDGSLSLVFNELFILIGAVF